MLVALLFPRFTYKHIHILFTIATVQAGEYNSKLIIIISMWTITQLHTITSQNNQTKQEL